MTEPKKILLINFGGIGDEILFLPVIESIKAAYPAVEVTLCLEPRSKSIKDLSGLIDAVIEVDIKGKNKYLELLKLVFKCYASGFDAVVSSGANSLIPILLFLTGIKTRVGYDSGTLSRFLLTKSVKLNKNQYAAGMYHDLVSEMTGKPCMLPKIEVEAEPQEENAIVLHPGVSKMSKDKNMVKSFSGEKWAEIAEKLLASGMKVYLAGGPDDKECIEKIRESLSHLQADNFVDYYGKTKNILDLARLIKRTGKILCSDSAPMHIGVGVGAKTYAIFGATDEKKLLPESEKFVPIKNNTHCRPCLFEVRQTTCENPQCLDISAEEVVGAVLGNP